MSRSLLSAANARASQALFAAQGLLLLGLLLLGLLLLGCTSGAPQGIEDSGQRADLSLPRRDASPSPADLANDHGPYPIVLVHGFFGFEQIGPLTYFHGVPEALLQAGHVVEVAALDPFNSSYVRGEQLLTQVQEILTRTGAAKVNLIAHSQGGLDSRYVAHKLPQRVGAIVTIATPHHGARLADVLMEAVPGFSAELVAAFSAAVARPLYGSVADDADLYACLDFLRSASVATFNAATPLPPSVALFSIGGRSNLALAEEACRPEENLPFVSRYDGERDPTDPLLVVTGALLSDALSGSLLDPVPNDGLVRVQESRQGIWLGCIPADHWDEIGQLLGDGPGLGNDFDHERFYLELAAFLVQRGY